MDLWNALTGLIFLLSAGTFVVLARHLSRRPVEEENRLALLQFATWWYGIGAISAISGIESLSVWVGTLPLAEVVGLTYLTVLVLCVALGGLLGHLVFLYTGRHRLFPLSLFYGLLYLLLLFYISFSEPSAVTSSFGRVGLSYARPVAEAWTLLAVGLLIVPEIGAAIAYLSLSWRTSAPTLRFRIRLVGGAIVLWFTVGPLQGAVESSLGLTVVASPLLGVIAAFLVLVAYHPPQLFRRLWHVGSVDEHPLRTGRTLLRPTTEGLWEPTNVPPRELRGQRNPRPAPWEGAR